MRAKEGSVVKCPIPTFNRAHDMGPLTGQGLRITHDLSSLVGNVALANIAVTLPTGLSSPNVSITNLGNNVYRIGNIRTPEDYLAGTAVIDLPTDVSNITFSFTSTVLNQNNNVTFVVNSTITVDDSAEWIIPNPPYPTGNLQLSLWPMVYANNATTQFDDTKQTAYVGDLENPDAGPYTVILSTQDISTRISLDATGVGNVVKSLQPTPTGLSSLKLVGSRSNINTYLANLTITNASLGTGHPKRNFTSNGSDTLTMQGTVSGIWNNAYQFTPSISARQKNDGTWSDLITYVNDTTSPLTLEYYFLVSATDLGYKRLSNLLGIWTGIQGGSGNFRLIVSSTGYESAPTNPFQTYYWLSSNPYTFTMSFNTWYHFAIVRNGGFWRTYLNGNQLTAYPPAVTPPIFPNPYGSQVPTNLYAPFALVNSQGMGRIGGTSPETSVANDYRIEGLRISTQARYTAPFNNVNNNYAIYVDNQGAATPFFNDGPNTSALFNFDNALGDANTIPGLNNGNITWSLTNPSGLNSNLYQEYTYPLPGSLTIGNVALARFGSWTTQHTQKFAAGNVPYVLATAPYTVGGLSNDFIAVDGTSTITIVDSLAIPPGNYTATYNMTRSETRGGIVALPGVGNIYNVPGNVAPGLFDTFRVNSNVRTQGNTVISFDTSVIDNILYYQYDTFTQGSVTAVQNSVFSVGVPPSYRDNRAAWRWMNTGSTFSDINGVSVRVDSIQLQGNVGGWTSSSGFYGDWSGIRGYNPSQPLSNEFSFGVRVFAPGTPSVPSIDSTSWRFSPLSNRPGLTDWRTFTWVQPSTNFGLWEGGPYTIGNAGFFASSSVTYAANSAKPLQCDLQSFAMASTSTTKYATVVFTVAQPTLDATIPTPGGGNSAPISYTQTVSLLYGN